MKPRNFPARKLERRFNTLHTTPRYTKEQFNQLEFARTIRTKKDRRLRAKIPV